MDPHALSLQCDHTTGAENAVEGVVEAAGEELGAGADRVATIDDDSVIGFGVALVHEGAAVGDVQMNTRVGEAAGDVGEVILAEMNNALIKFGDVYAFDAWVADDLAHNPAVATADNKDRAGRKGERAEGQVYDALLVRALVLLSELYGAIERKHVPVGGGSEDHGVLNPCVL